MSITQSVIDLWGQRLSASQVASRTGLTRNAVIGRVDRLRRARDPALLNAEARRGPRLNRTAQVAEWMAEYDGRICDCARAINLDPESTRKAWRRVCRDMGEQAV